jgi:hypothetical protein
VKLNHHPSITCPHSPHHDLLHCCPFWASPSPSSLQLLLKVLLFSYHHLPLTGCLREQPLATTSPTTHLPLAIGSQPPAHTASQARPQGLLLTSTKALSQPLP